MAAAVVNDKIIYFGGGVATYVLQADEGPHLLRMTCSLRGFSFTSGLDSGSYRAFKGKLYAWPGNTHPNQLFCLSLDTGQWTKH